MYQKSTIHLLRSVIMAGFITCFCIIICILTQWVHRTCLSQSSADIKHAALETELSNN